MPDFVRADAAGFEELALKLRRAAEMSTPEVDKGLLVIGEAHAQKARDILAGHSTSIPPTIRTRLIPGAVEITAASSPLAWAYQKGNKKDRKTRTFQHPVFAKRGDPQYDRSDWVEQPRYRFFRFQRKFTLLVLTKAWGKGLSRSGIRVE